MVALVHGPVVAWRLARVHPVCGLSRARADMVRKRSWSRHSRAFPSPEHSAPTQKLACPPCNHMIVAVCYGLAMVRSRRCDRPLCVHCLISPIPRRISCSTTPRASCSATSTSPAYVPEWRATRPLSPSPGRAARTKRESRCGVSPSRPRRLSSRVPAPLPDHHRRRLNLVGRCRFGADRKRLSRLAGCHSSAPTAFQGICIAARNV